MLTTEQIESVCCSYSLGLPVAPLTRVTGGLLHSMFCLQTERGHYALKVLDRYIMEIPEIRSSFRLSEIISADIAEAGVPAVCALSGDQGTVADFETATVIVYPWLVGAVLPFGPAGPLAGSQIGVILGRIHRLSLDPSRFGTSERSVSDPAEWRRLTEAGHGKKVPWAEEISEMLPTMIGWEEAGLRASLRLGERRVVSHCDLDQKNVLWSDPASPWLIDWESVGPIHPAVDVVGAALDWSGQSVGAPDRETFAALLSAYRSVVDLSANDCRAALQVNLAAGLGWLKANMDRSVNPCRSKEEQDVGMREVSKTAIALRSLSGNMAAWEKWCE